MSHPRPKDGSLGVDDPRLTRLCEQFLADCDSLPEGVLTELTALSGVPEAQGPQIEACRAYLKESPLRLKNLAVVAMPHMPYSPLLQILDVYTPQLLPATLMEEVNQLLGDLRTHLCILYLNEKCRGVDMMSPTRLINLDKNQQAVPLPSPEKVAEAFATYQSLSLPFPQMLEEQHVKRALAAEQELLKIEKEEKLAAARRAAVREREQAEVKRGKEKAAADAKSAAEQAFAKERSGFQADIAALKQKLAKMETELESARATQPIAGLTQDDLAKVKAELEQEYEDRYLTKLEETIGPWIKRQEQAEAAYLKAKDALRLSEDALAMARAEAAKDQLSLWETEPLAALPIIERRLAEVDELIIGTVKPSEALLKIHRDLRAAMDACRSEVERIQKAKPESLMVKAIGATIKSLDFDNLKQIAASINDLAENKVLTDAESTAISRMVNDEIGLRTARKEFEASSRTLLMKDLHGSTEVEILVDAYNFMHIAKQHFGKLGVPRDYDPTKLTFGPQARRKIAEMFKVIPAKFKKARVIIFLDGRNVEDRTPYPGVSFRLPTVQRGGEGQADAEILKFIKDEARARSSVYIVSNDKQLQLSANRFLSIGVCCGLLEEIS